MSDLGLQPAPQPATTTRRTSEPAALDIPIWVVLVAILVMLAMAAATAFIVLREPNEREYPDRWDRRVAPYVKIVERERGLDFRHPVAVRFLPRAEFEKGVTADKDDLTAEDRTEIEQDTGLMRAIGLMSRRRRPVQVRQRLQRGRDAGLLLVRRPEDHDPRQEGDRGGPRRRWSTS